jgi:hypothetical protein
MALELVVEIPAPLEIEVEVPNPVMEMVLEIETPVFEFNVEFEGPDIISKEVRQALDFPYFWIGKAVNGSLETDPVWKIYRTEYDIAGEIVETLIAENVAWVDYLTATYI